MSRPSNPPPSNGEDTLCNLRRILSSEWSGDNSGRIDFRLASHEWGFGILREGDRLAEHCERFAPGGRYYKFIQDGQIRDWMILNCRTSRLWLYGRKSISLPIVFLFAGACANCIWHSKGGQCGFYGGKSADWDSEMDMCVHPSGLSARWPPGPRQWRSRQRLAC
jgi:hypothetical protein